MLLETALNKSTLVHSYPMLPLSLQAADCFQPTQWLPKSLSKFSVFSSCPWEGLFIFCEVSQSSPFPSCSGFAWASSQHLLCIFCLPHEAWNCLCLTIINSFPKEGACTTSLQGSTRIGLKEHKHSPEDINKTNTICHTSIAPYV